ncbi:MAG: malonyl CoA-acyl carrier protein transacylase [Micromonosporaceae bacterium]|jgi:malonyl CoA-acyl carrier protein transacylase|nr:malonyl CoA-acyl carrier protein transacylase [Micromonosporaceae bacterium]MDT5035532.1 malonyl CoA-acyl carrier protein transacylase [Micromonosporaceae bacterium]
MTVSYVFPGQGSHRPGMGRELFARYPHLVHQADRLLGYSIVELCLESSNERLTDTRFTQSAMYVVGALSYVDRVRETGTVPDVVAGHSLGEYVALFAAGAFDFLTGLELVRRRAELMAAAGPGAMAAVIGLDADAVALALQRGRLSDVDIANYNAPTQVVISGGRDDVRTAGELLAPEAVAVVPLNVSGAFHSRHMAAAAREFGVFLRRYRFAALRVPVIANTTAAPHTDAGLADELQRQLVAPVRWEETVRYLLDQPDPQIVEVGPGQVLTGLVNQVRDRVPQGRR